METLSGVKGENAVKIFGPNLEKLERSRTREKDAQRRRGIENVDLPHQGAGQASNSPSIAASVLCGMSVFSDVQDVLATAVGGKSLTQVVEGERKFDVTLRWPERLVTRRNDSRHPGGSGNNRVSGEDIASDSSNSARSTMRADAETIWPSLAVAKT